MCGSWHLAITCLTVSDCACVGVVCVCQAVVGTGGGAQAYMHGCVSVCVRVDAKLRSSSQSAHAAWVTTPSDDLMRRHRHSAHALLSK